MRTGISLTVVLCAMLAVGCNASSGDDDHYANNPQDDRSPHVGSNRSGGAGGQAYVPGHSADAGAYDPHNEFGGAGGAAGGGGGGGFVGEAPDDGEPRANEGGGDGSPQPWRRPSDEVQFAKVDVGDGNTLDLVRMRVMVQVEGLRARTIVDHVFYNPHGRALEGTFKYPLPTEANVSYYGMFLGTGTDDKPGFFGPRDELGNASAAELARIEPEDIAQSADADLWSEFRVGRVVPAEKAREVYEEVTRRRVDPALVEEVAPNQFEARVFPIQAQGYNRVIIAYEQTLPRLDNELMYNFPVPSGELESFDFVLSSDNTAGAAHDESEVADVIREEREQETLFRRSFEGQTPGGWLDLRFAQPEQRVVTDTVAGQAPGDDESYFYTRIKAPAVDDQVSRVGASKAIFMLDTSLSAHPERFAIDVALVEAIMANSPEIERFAVMTFDVSARWLTDGMVANTPEKRALVANHLEGVLLEGATDFGAALNTLSTPPFELSEDDLVDVFVMSDGVISWGDGDAARLVAQAKSKLDFETRFFAYRTGLGAENLTLYQALTREGAIFNCMSLDAVPDCARAHTAPGLILSEVVAQGFGDTPGAIAELLVAGRQATLFPGAQITVAGRITQPGDVQLRLLGHRAGVETEVSVPVSLVPTGELAPRAWAEVAVAQLLQTRDADLERLAVALSQRYRIISRATSFLVLETDAEYDEYGIEAERANVGDDTIVALVDDALESLGAGLSDWQMLERVLVAAADVHQVLGIDGGELLNQLIHFGGGPDALSIPRESVDSPLIYAADVPADYVRNLRNEDVARFRAESDRRFDDGDTGAAIRALSSVIEANPSNPEAGRLVGYRLGAWNLDSISAGVFFDILRRRPYEPQSYRDLAYAVQDTRPALAALLFEAVLSGNWHSRFHRLTVVAAEEYALFVRGQVRRSPDSPLTVYLMERILELGIEIPRTDLRVTLSWNTDNTDIDLWVTTPAGEKCYYRNRNVASGGELLDDVTQGFGPERFQDVDAEAGEYIVQAHYYGNNGNRLSAATHLRLSVIRNAGTDQETVEVHTAVLERTDQIVTLARVRF